MIAIVIIIMVAPGLIALLLHNWLNRSGKASLLSSLLTWFIYSFFILLGAYLALYLLNRGASLNLSLGEGSDLLRASFMLKALLTLLALAVALPLGVRALGALKTILRLALAKRRRKPAPEGDFVEKALHFFLNLDEAELKKLAALRDSVRINGGRLGVYSPVYDLHFDAGAGIALFKTRAEVEACGFSTGDALLVISEENEVLPAMGARQVTLTAGGKASGEGEVVQLPLFGFRDEAEKRIETALLQGLLDYLLGG